MTVIIDDVTLGLCIILGGAKNAVQSPEGSGTSSTIHNVESSPSAMFRMPARAPEQKDWTPDDSSMCCEECRSLFSLVSRHYNITITVGSYVQDIYIIQGVVCLSVCLSVCLLQMAGRTAGPIKTTLGIGTHVDPGSVLVKVKVEDIYRGPQGRDNRSSMKRRTGTYREF